MLGHDVLELQLGAHIIFDHELVLGQLPLHWVPKQVCRALPRTAVLEHLDTVSVEKQYFLALLASFRVLTLSFGNEVTHIVGGPLYLVGFQVAKVNCLCASGWDFFGYNLATFLVSKSVRRRTVHY